MYSTCCSAIICDKYRLAEMNYPFNEIGTVTLVGWGQDKEKAQKLQPVTEQEYFTFSLNYTHIDESDTQVVFLVQTKLMTCTDTAYIYNTCK